MKLTQGGAEFVRAAVDRIPQIGDAAQTFLGFQFRFPVLLRGLFLKRGEDLEITGYPQETESL